MGEALSPDLEAGLQHGVSTLRAQLRRAASSQSRGRPGRSHNPGTGTMNGFPNTVTSVRTGGY